MATSTLTPQLRASWRFMHANAGWCEPPGHAACALTLARAEQVAEARGWDLACEADPHEAGEWLAVLYAASHPEDSLQVLGGVDCSASEAPAYWRVLRAELASWQLAEAGEAEVPSEAAAAHEAAATEARAGRLEVGGLVGEANAPRAYVTASTPFERGVVQQPAGHGLAHELSRAEQWARAEDERLALPHNQPGAGPSYVRPNVVRANQLRGGSPWHEGTSVRVRSELGGGRYMGREATVVRVYPVGEATGAEQQHKVCVQLRQWNGLVEAHDGRLYLNLEEVELA